VDSAGALDLALAATSAEADSVADLAVDRFRLKIAAAHIRAAAICLKLRRQDRH